MSEEATAEVVEEVSGEDLTVEESTEAPNILDMSDEEFAETMMIDFQGDSFDQPEAASEEDSASAEASEEVVNEESSEEFNEDGSSKLLNPSEDVSHETLELEGEETADETVSEKEEDNQEEEKELSSDEIVQQIFSPFRANGKEMQVENIDDVRQLMQMGANYNKKMAALKPNLKLMKMLQNNDLLDEGKLSFLIDLDKKNPDAIKKLIADSKIDIDDLDTDEQLSYKPSTYTVNDKEVELDETLADIRETESYAKTLDVISNKWDESSKTTLLQNPAAIRVLNDHVANGIYDKINAAVETERMLGRIPNSMSDIEAYKYVGDMINARGGLQQTPPNKSVTKRAVSKTANKTVDPKLNERKKAASSTRGTPKTKSKDDFNPLSMSDEDFEKLSMDQFI